VLLGELAPAALVTMSAADLANKDLAEWRRKVEEEHDKAIQLDVEAAAKVRGVCVGGGADGYRCEDRVGTWLCCHQRGCMSARGLHLSLVS
jgi:hypothetical protein